MRGPAIVTVVAYDQEHKLKHGRHHKAWLDMKDSEIASATRPMSCLALCSRARPA